MDHPSSLFLGIMDLKLLRVSYVFWSFSLSTCLLAHMLVGKFSYILQYMPMSFNLKMHCVTLNCIDPGMARAAVFNKFLAF